VKTFEELVAEARRAGVLKFCASGIAVLERKQTVLECKQTAAIAESSEKGIVSSDTPVSPSAPLSASLQLSVG
jgi:hypothetical protein